MARRQCLSRLISGATQRLRGENKVSREKKRKKEKILEALTIVRIVRILRPARKGGGRGSEKLGNSHSRPANGTFDRLSILRTSRHESVDELYRLGDRINVTRQLAMETHAYRVVRYLAAAICPMASDEQSTSDYSVNQVAESNNREGSGR